ncbi:MAG: DMT family transporter [bacterium]
MDRRSAQGLLLVSMSGLCFASLGIFSEVAYGYGARPIDVLLIRYIIAAIFLWSVLLLFARDTVRVDVKDYRPLFIGGASFVFSSLLYAYALFYIPKRLAISLFFIYPIWVNIINTSFMGESWTLQRFGGVLSTLVGALLVAELHKINYFGVNPIGVTLALLAGLLYTIFNIFGQSMIYKYSTIAVTTYSITLGVMLFLAISGARFAASFPRDWRIWLMGLPTAVFSTSFAVLLYLRGMQRIGSSRTSLISNFQLMASSIAAFFFLREPLGWVKGAGFALICFGIILVGRERPQTVF